MNASTPIVSTCASPVDAAGDTWITLPAQEPITVTLMTRRGERKGLPLLWRVTRDARVIHRYPGAVLYADGI